MTKDSSANERWRLTKNKAAMLLNEGHSPYQVALRLHESAGLSVNALTRRIHRLEIEIAVERTAQEITRETNLVVVENDALAEALDAALSRAGANRISPATYPLVTRKPQRLDEDPPSPGKTANSQWDALALDAARLLQRGATPNHVAQILSARSEMGMDALRRRAELLQVELRGRTVIRAAREDHVESLAENTVLRRALLAVLSEKPRTPAWGWLVSRLQTESSARTPSVCIHPVDDPAAETEQ